MEIEVNLVDLSVPVRKTPDVLIQINVAVQVVHQEVKLVEMDAEVFPERHVLIYSHAKHLMVKI